MLAAIVFDAEGVVLDTEDLWDEAQAEFLGRRGVAYDRDLVKPLCAGRSLVEGVEVMRALYGFPGDAAALAAERLAIAAGLLAGVGLVPGFEDFHRLAEARFRLGLATAMAPPLFAAVREALALDARFEAVVTLDDAGGRGKPEPDLFLAAARRLGVPPASCAVIEDAPRGIEAARRAGMVAVGLATTFRADLLAGADVVANSFDDIDLDHLEALATRPQS
ncbi:MAG TPA: HAD family phosphatase [Acidimicrobiales bacterium]|nr:HAD family phosphatase [Acidimicrobiales bacterium]